MGRPAAPGVKVCGNCCVLLKPYIRTMYVYPFSERDPRLASRMVGWLVGWLVGRSVGWLAGWLVGWLVLWSG